MVFQDHKEQKVKKESQEKLKEYQVFQARKEIKVWEDQKESQVIEEKKDNKALKAWWDYQD